MKRHSTYILLTLTLSLGLCLSGCETTLELPNNNLPKLTIISHLSSDGWEKQRVFVYASQSPLDSSQFITPANLDVEVTELETDYSIRLDVTKEGNKSYFEFPKDFLKQGFSYSISAYAPGFESVHSTTTIPTPSTITNLNVHDVSLEPSIKNEFKSILRYKLSFNINHFESNRYYHLVFYNKYENLDSLLLIVDPELSDDQPFLHHYDFGILIDRNDLTPGEPLEFNFVNWVVAESELEEVYVELRTITESYYKYHSSLARQLIVRQDPFAEPVTIFNNIEGGYGNFSGFSPDVSSSYLPQ
ncbi:MAG: DUF4249 family protein [Saprospiraceae bacterium]|nr:DUF4249 family protein [Saprospiraceae bacterium]